VVVVEEEERALLAGLETKSELRRDIVGDVVVEDEVDGDVARAVLAVAVGVVVDPPEMAPDGERAGAEAMADGEGREA
jgi:hypothetical protein